MVKTQNERQKKIITRLHLNDKHLKIEENRKKKKKENQKKRTSFLVTLHSRVHQKKKKDTALPTEGVF